MRKIILCGTLVLFCFSAWAQKTGAVQFGSTAQPGRHSHLEQTTVIPQLIKFGGAIHNLQGQPVTGVANVLFSLYGEQNGGASLWSEVQSVELDSQGHYSILLGSAHDQGFPRDLFASGDARWLGIQLLQDGEPEQARTLLVSVPYALKSGDAETLGGRPASAYMLAQSFSGLESTSTSSAAAVTAGTTNKSSAVRRPLFSPPLGSPTSPVVTTNGTTNFLSKFANATTIVDSAIIDVNGFVGIGTAVPAAPLDVETTSNQGVDITTLASTFVNTVSPAVNQTTSAQQVFIADMEIRTSKNLNNAFANYSFIADFGSGTRNQVTGLLGEVYNDGTASASTVVGSSGYAENGGVVQDLAGLRSGSPNGASSGAVGVQTFAGGATTNQYGLWILSNLNAGSVTNNYGIKVENQGAVGTNNWALRTGTGLVQFGDRAVFAPGTATAASLNIPAGATPGTLVGGDIWNSGGLLQFFDGSASKTLAFTSNVVDLSNAQTINGTKTFSSAIAGNITGNAVTATLAGNVTGIVAIANGGTGANTSAGARVALSAAASGANSDITSLSGLTTPLSIAQGGTGSNTQNFVDLTTAQTIGGVKTYSAEQILRASTASAASARYQPGVAPTVPVAGDFWNLGASLQFRDNAGTPATHTIADLDSVQTLTNKSMSGSSNTFTNLPNGAFANNSVTVSAGSGLAGGGTVALGGTTSLNIPSAGVSNAMLANNSVTVTAGSGLSGGGTVALGGAISLASTGVTSVAGTANQISPTAASTGAVTLSFPLAGVTLPGTTTLTASTAGGTSLNIPAGAAPAAPAVGDIWNDGLNLHYRDNTPSSRTIATISGTQNLTNKTIDTAGGNVIQINGNTLTATAGTATVTVPNSTDTLLGRATTDTLTNKSISGSLNTFSNIPNSALANSSVTVTAGTGLSGGGTVALGGSITLTSTAAVSSVGLNAPSEFTVSGSPVTTSGTLTFTKANQTANTIYAGPATGAAAAPAFRNLASVDMPTTVLQNGGITIPLTVSVPATNVIKGTCTSPDVTVAVTGAKTSMVVLVSPVAPLDSQWQSSYSWNAYVLATDTVAFHICNLTKFTAFGATAQTVNIRFVQ